MFFDRFFPKLLITVKAQDDEEEELVDPQQQLRDMCKETSHCQHYEELFKECEERVNSKPNTAETCTQELMDWLHAIDHCVTKDLFKRLK